ncbi:MAG: preprotein translocase subunit SecY [Nanoarchaeota archaeon]|nr:preprotein translocase subunit SecY [Nanoarchaeota archaeon]
MALKDLLSNLPEVKGPSQRRLPFNEKLKWTLIMLIAFYLLSSIPLWGLGQNALSQFEYLSIILGAKFGSIMSLGIGPIVTASIVLQLLKGSGMLKLDTNTHDGRVFFQGLQKVLAVFFIVFEALIFVFMGGLSPSSALTPALFRSMEFVLVGQLCLGGLMVLFMDEVINKWGFGSGISLFIAAGVSAEIMIKAFSPLTAAGTLAFGSAQAPVGKVWVLFTSLLGKNPYGAGLALSAIIATVIAFCFAVYAQAMKIEIPLSFGRVRGHGIRWPLNFIYASVIPVILVSALIANMQLWARLMENWGYPLLGTFAGGAPASGFILWINSPNLIEQFLTGSFQWISLAHALVYILFMIGGSMVFAVFWVQTAGMDAKSQAAQMMSSGLQIPGFRRDPRVLESILKRYITPLTVMGGALVGFLAASADLLGALSRGTGILLAVMIIYKLYEEIAQQHMFDMNPALRKMMGK